MFSRESGPTDPNKYRKKLVIRLSRSMGVRILGEELEIDDSNFY